MASSKEVNLTASQFNAGAAKHYSAVVKRGVLYLKCSRFRSLTANWFSSPRYFMIIPSSSKQILKQY